MSEEQKNTADLAPPKTTFERIKDDTKEMVNKLLSFFRSDEAEDNITVKSPTTKILQGIHKALVEQEAMRKEDSKNDKKSGVQEERDNERRHRQIIKTLLAIPQPSEPEVEIKKKEEEVEDTKVKSTGKKTTKGKKPTARRTRRKATIKKTTKKPSKTKPTATAKPKTNVPTPKPSASKLGAGVAAGGVAVAAVIGTSNAIAAVEQVGDGYNVVKRPDGSVEKQVGDRNWRNNNPGNIEYGDFAKSKGAIGTDGRFAIFPTYETGRKAKESLIFEGKNYKDLPLTAAIARYAPPRENNTAVYQQNALAAVGGLNKKMSEYNETERTNILNAIQKQEGFKQGKTIALTKPTTEIQQAKSSVGQTVENKSTENKQIKTALADIPPTVKVTNNVSSTQESQSQSTPKKIDERSPMERKLQHG